MHQPFYKDLVSGEYRLPWTRMHALKDYYGMVRILEEFPGIRQTFNLVPSMIVQVEEYARGEANDPFLACSLKPAETLTFDEQAFILRNFFMANPGRMIYRYPRYGELYNAWLARKTAGSGHNFNAQDFRDLQILSQLAWFDEEFQEHDPEVRQLVAKGRNYNLDDQSLMGRKQREICAHVIPEYRKLAASGQIEISTTPFYHPILPLLCDSDIASVAHPHVPLPPRFCHPEDARLQLQMSRDYISRVFGVAPVGLWPSEGSVSDHVLDIAASVGFEWAATDNGVLERTLRRPATPEVAYKPWIWSQHDRQMKMIFRDHQLSDLIGFVYSGVGAAEGAEDFLRRIRENCLSVLASGRDALVPIILDGENAWEYYDHNGRPFFRELYSRIQNDPDMEAITISDAFTRMQAEPLGHIFPGSWINANFDVWIGDQEDNRSWRLLLEARKAYDDTPDVPEERRKLALEELLIAEGSDWNWWYGPEHSSENRVEFDQIYREHLANVYRALGLPGPAELSNPILRLEVDETHTPPLGPVKASINGVVDSYFEWLGAGIYKVDQRSGSMHGKRALVREVHYGVEDATVYIRVDFEEPGSLGDLDVIAELNSATKLTIRLAAGELSIVNGIGRAAFKDVMEIALPAVESDSPTGSRLRLSFWQDGLPVQSVPPQDYLTVLTPTDGV
jgi:alpha-amylase/alpha-mannosidase (GH57 family)